MHHAALLKLPSLAGDDSPRHELLRHAIDHAAHLLPSQGPITVFVHHNTLHAFEDLPFEQAVKQGMETFGCHPFLPEEQYHAMLANGRIRPDDIAAVVLEDLGDDADELIGFMGTRYHLWLAMLENPPRIGSDAEVQWLIAESDVLWKFRADAPVKVRERLIKSARQWVMERLESPPDGEPAEHQALLDLLFRQFRRETIETWNDAAWESFSLHLLWRICRRGALQISRAPGREPDTTRHASALRRATGVDIDEPVNELLIRFCSAFLDQGYANWQLPERDQGFFHAFLALYRRSRPSESWTSGIVDEIRVIDQARLDPLESIDRSLRLLGVEDRELEEYVTQTLLALPGWAGMLWQMETNAEWTVRPAPAGTLREYLAIRLILERSALADFVHAEFGAGGDLADLRQRLRSRIAPVPHTSADQRAFALFQLSQVRGWTNSELSRLTDDEWKRVIREMESFSGFERRRLYHRAYERRYRNQALDAIIAHNSRPALPQRDRRSFQLITCIDDREESFRRHLEEIDPDCQTYGAPGFYAVAIYYQGAADAHFRPLCPVVIKPQHYVRESAAYSLIASSRQRQETRKTLGTASHQWHVQSRTFWGGMLTALLGSVASVPMVTRILFPRITSQFGRVFGRLIQPPPITELMLLRTEDPPGPEGEHLGYSRDEMADSVERILRDTGLTRDFARIVLLLGHGSSSLNNPHESAYNCGACSGGRGGPNARSFAFMANLPEVRARLRQRGIEIPATTIFVGGYHNTCDEDVVFFDLDRIPTTHRREFEAARDVIDEARARNAHEKSRRFESADLKLTPRQALEHVQTRAEDLSQARPEYNHATNAMTVVGRRCRTRGLFMDRRAFLNEYDPHQDDADSAILARILSAAVPVCAGISLEYYFSCVDVAGYGCGSKLPHNIVSLLGVMEGAASDLRTGLSQQMIEIHEPMRNLFVIETTPEAMLGIMNRNPAICRLVRNEWVQLAVLDPDRPVIQLFQHGEFVPYHAGSSDLPAVPSSIEWYQGQRHHLGFATIGSCSRIETSIDQETDE